MHGFGIYKLPQSDRRRKWRNDKLYDQARGLIFYRFEKAIQSNK